MSTFVQQVCHSPCCLVRWHQVKLAESPIRRHDPFIYFVPVFRVVFPLARLARLATFSLEEL